MNTPRRNMEMLSSAMDAHEEFKGKGWRCWARMLWCINCWSLFSMVFPIAMIALARMHAGEYGSAFVEKSGIAMLGFVTGASVWSSIRLWLHIRATRRYYKGLPPPWRTW